MKLILLFPLILAVLVVAIVAIGWLLPVRHSATREASLAATPREVWRLITDFEGAAGWRPDVRSVEKVAAPDGGVLWKELDSRGHGLLYAVEDRREERRLVRRIASRDVPFGGKWTFELDPSGTGSRLRITEDGEVYHPIYRFVSRFVMGHGRTLEGYLSALRRKLGES